MPLWYYNKHVPTEDRSCPCGELLQSRDHIIATCPEYENQRQILKSASEDLVTSDILGTTEGIEALIKFLRTTSAFSRPHPSRSTSSTTTTLLRPPLLPRSFPPSPLPHVSSDISHDPHPPKVPPAQP